MPKFTKYGCSWEQDTHPLEIERYAIRKGGKWTLSNGQECGEGLFHHYRSLESILWPDDYQNRWTDWMLDLLLTERICCFGGSKDSGKTRRVSKWALMDYWCFPNTTLILMTSTTNRGLELRVWGDIKSLFQRATENFPWLEGNPVDSKHGIFTDSVDDDVKIRDLRKGILGIPTMTSEGAYDGSALTEFAGIKQVRRRLIGDECFPAGTMINTLKGLVPIELIYPGDLVFSASGLNRVVATSEREADTLIRIVVKDKRELVCTWSHPILTHLGWKMACEIHEGHYIMGFYESMQELRKANQEPNGVFKEVLLRVDENARGNCSTLHSGETNQGNCQGQGKDELRKQSHENGGVPEKGKFCSEVYGAPTESQRRQRNGTNQGGVAVNENVSRGGVELWDKNGKMEWQRVPTYLQSGLGVSEPEACYRGRREQSFKLEQSKASGREKDQILTGSWVDSVEILKQGDSGFPKSDTDSGRCRVFNLQVEGHPSYSVNGLIVHNCQFVSVDYLKVLFAMDAGNFKGAFLGNMIAENGKALDRIAEPEAGWGSEGEVKKTTAWRNKYGGVTLNLVGIDSPNLDPATKNKFPGMLTQESIDRAAKLPGAKDSVEWWSQIMGVRKVGVVSDRVLLISDIKNNGGFGDVVWATTPQKGLAIDAGYGGDDCVKTYFEYGEEVSGTNVLVFKEQAVYPVAISSEITPEDQIANAAKADCDEYGIPYSNVFIEAGMRATLAVSFGRILSPSINAINFGGSATERPVNNDLFVFDEKTQQRRLKTCKEHYSKFVTEIAFAVRDLVMCGQARLFPMPAAEEFQKRKWNFVYGDRYELETKLEYKERNASKSPNFSDSIMIAVEGARRLGFQIERPPIELVAPTISVVDNKGNTIKYPLIGHKPPPKDDQWIEDELDSQRAFERQNSLQYDS